MRPFKDTNASIITHISQFGVLFMCCGIIIKSTDVIDTAADFPLFAVLSFGFAYVFWFIGTVVYDTYDSIMIKNLSQQLSAQGATPLYAYPCKFEVSKNTRKSGYMFILSDKFYFTEKHPSGRRVELTIPYADIETAEKDTVKYWFQICTLAGECFWFRTMHYVEIVDYLRMAICEVGDSSTEDYVQPDPSVRINALVTSVRLAERTRVPRAIIASSIIVELVSTLGLTLWWAGQVSFWITLLIAMLYALIPTAIFTLVCISVFLLRAKICSNKMHATTERVERMGRHAVISFQCEAYTPEHVVGGLFLLEDKLLFKALSTDSELTANYSDITALNASKQNNSFDLVVADKHLYRFRVHNAHDIVALISALTDSLQLGGAYV